MPDIIQPIRNGILESDLELSEFEFTEDGVPVVFGGAWGSITGTLSNQTDLQNALNSKLTQAAADLLYSPLGHVHSFASLSGKPTTLSGYSITDAYTKTEIDNAVSSAVVGLLDDRGNYNASGNVFPSSGGSGSAGAILKGDLWTISVGGTLNGIAVTAGDVLRALVDTPGQTGANWVVTENNLGYVPVNAAGTLSLAGFSSITGTLPAVNVATLNQNTTGSAAKWTTARNLAGNSVDGSANVTFSNNFIVQGTADAGLSAAQFLGALGTGIVKNTTTTGVLSIAVAGDFPTLNQSTTGSAATLTTARSIYGNNFDGSAALGQIIASTYGGTGNGFTKFSGPTTSERTKTLRDASDTILELSGSYMPTGTWTNLTLVTPALGTPASGVVTNLTGTASININGTVGATTPTTGVFTTLVAGSTTSLLVGTAGSTIGNIGFRNATSGTATLAPPTGALGTYSVTLPNAASTLPILGQQITFAGPTAARTVTLPDASFTVARTDAGNAFTGAQTISSNLTVGSVSNDSDTLITTDRSTLTSGISFRNAGVTKGYIGVDVTAGNIITGSATNDMVLRAATNMLFAAGATEKMRIDASRVTMSIPAKLKGYTVAALPAGSEGDMAYATDLLTPAFLTTAVGGGATKGPVFYNGTAWVAI